MAKKVGLSECLFGLLYTLAKNSTKFPAKDDELLFIDNDSIDVGSSLQG